ncbi:hypothetical protein EJB05_39031, partial [Eragrostis curvula]
MLTDRIAVVTGGAEGIGLEVCRQLANKFDTVFLTARDTETGEAAVEQLGLSNVVFFQLDLNDALSITHFADFLQEWFGKVDILVNLDSIGAVEVTEAYEVAMEGLHTNYYGTKRVTEAFIPLLHSSSDGRIVIVSSGWLLLRIFNEELKRELNDMENPTEELVNESLTNFLGAEPRSWPTVFAAYTAAMNACTRILARAHPDLRVNCVYPGYVYPGVLSPEEGAGNVTTVALQPGGPTGQYFALGKVTHFL